MFRRVRTYAPIVGADGHAYTPRAYGDPKADGTWSAYLGFFPAAGHVWATDHQAITPDLPTLISWADSLTVDDLHAALARAKILNRQSMAEDELADLEVLEREALSDAASFEQQAELDKTAAENALSDAKVLRRERVNLEARLADEQAGAATQRQRKDSTS